MKHFIFTILLAAALILPVSAAEITAPSVPPSAVERMPEKTESFSEGLWYLLKSALPLIQPSLVSCARICLSIIAVSLLTAILQTMGPDESKLHEMVGAVTIAALLLQPSNALIRLGMNTVGEISEYGKLLLPVLTTGLAAQGGSATSAALYAGTAFFATLLSSLIVRLLCPMLYIFLCLSVANGVVGHELLQKLRSLVKDLSTWCLKNLLYLFTGYMSVTQVVTGTADASAVKAAKLTISSIVPVVGGILSETSEAVLIGAGMLKNAAGVYGLLAILAVWIGPFVRIGAQYLLLKFTAAICTVFSTKGTSSLIEDFSTVMGLLLAMTGGICLLFLISVICFMKGVG